MTTTGLAPLDKLIDEFRGDVEKGYIMPVTGKGEGESTPPITGSWRNRYGKGKVKEIDMTYTVMRVSGLPVFDIECCELEFHGLRRFSNSRIIGYINRNREEIDGLRIEGNGIPQVMAGTPEGDISGFLRSAPEGTATLDISFKNGDILTLEYCPDRTCLYTAPLLEDQGLNRAERGFLNYLTTK
jgi:hypothetical protein